MIKVVSVFFPLFLILGSISVQAKEVKLFCYTLKGYPQGTSFIINTENKKVFEVRGYGALKPEREYQIVSWSSDKIIFNEPPNSIRKIIGYIGFSIDRMNLDFYSFQIDKDGNLREQLFGKCEIPHATPQF
jgi:hypothetical protein